MLFGEKLLAWRRYRGLTQTALAKETGVAQPNLAALEAGRLEPKLSTVQRLAAALRIPAGRLIDYYPPRTRWNRHRIDAFVEQAMKGESAPTSPQYRMASALRVVASGKLAAAGRPVALRGRTGERLVKQLRADLGPQLWEAVVRRLDKHL
jgi:transcriptional regulator with XRE-family HTH domain